MWDVFAVSTYATISLLFWYVGLIPDFATLRDRAKNPYFKFVYAALSWGWRGSARHWHRYEVNNRFRATLEQHGMQFSAISVKDDLAEMIELPDHPWFVACQFHPEFTSTPRDGHPLFSGFVNAALRYAKKD